MHDKSLNDGTNGGSVKSNEVMEKLGAYVDGELSPVEREAIETLLERDKSCREIVHSFRYLDEAARLETIPPVNAGEWARIWEAIQRRKDLPLTQASSETASATIIDNRWLYRLAAMAAVIALVAIVGFRMMQTSDTPREIVQPPPSPELQFPGLLPSEDGLDNSEDEDAGTGIGFIEGIVPDEIGEDSVKYRDF